MDITWDPEIDTPATVAVIGGGPVGVEAALYARFLGYSVMLFDARKVGHRQLAWGDHLMDLSWGDVTSPLGLAALEAQGTAQDLPPAHEHVSFRCYVEKYLLPVARTDLLYDSVQINAKVVSVSRTGCGLIPSLSLERRAEQEFRLLVDSQQRGEYTQLADIVLDCTGLEQRCGLASGAGLALREIALRSQMFHGKVDVLGALRPKFSGQHSLLFGRNRLAVANAIDLAALAVEQGTRTTWILPKRLGEDLLQDWQAPTDAAYGITVQSLINNENPNLVCMPVWGVEAIQQSADQWEVRLQVGEEETLDIRGSLFVNCNDCIRDWSFAHSLLIPVDESEDVVCPEPHYYTAGQKASRSHCSMLDCFGHIRRIFSLIGGRADLDLYETVRRQNA